MTSPMHNKSNQVPVPQTPVQNINEMDYQLPDDDPVLPTPEHSSSNATERDLHHVDTSHQDVFVGPDTDPFEIFDQISTLPLPPMPSNFFDGISGMDLDLETEGPGAGNRSSPYTDPSAPLPKEPRTTTELRDEASGFEILRVEDPLICETCMGEFPDHRSLSAHITRKHNSITSTEWECDHCKRVLSTKQKLAQHLNSAHGGLLEHICECGAGFSTSYALALHRVAQHGSELGAARERKKPLRAFRCLYCGQIRKQRTAMVRHVSAIHKREERS